ncbi:MAG TPA: hypothetical protein DCS31_04500, partial [Candidatus Competibacteraceae bacterium]|nr:hypothetical protein [Candidatus Competibacteraceae bacterium]
MCFAASSGVRCSRAAPVGQLPAIAFRAGEREALPLVIGFLLAGALFGLSGGLSPGPLLALVLNETLRYGVRGGIRVALAPLLTDAPIILITIGLLWPLTNRSLPLAVINIGGGGYLVWLGIEGLRFRGVQRTLVNRADSLRRGVIANFLNPSPYLFWL